jgi:hypothetical protein
MKARTLLAVLLLCTAASAQTSAPAATQPATQPAPSTVLLLAQQIDQIGQTAATDISRLRIDKWKTEGDQKQISQSNAASLQRNLTSALPTLTLGVKNAPNDIASSFKLYRNLNALYDVMKGLAESAGAFGKKEEFEVLSQDLGTLDGYRRSLADYVEQLAAYKDAASRQGASVAAAAQNKSGVKRIIVDDTAPTKKKTPTKKK